MRFEPDQKERFLRSPDFQHPVTRIPCHFLWNIKEEVITLEICEDQDLSALKEVQKETISACAEWGPHSCGSKAEANRIIRTAFPDLWDRGIHF